MYDPTGVVLWPFGGSGDSDGHQLNAIGLDLKTDWLGNNFGPPRNGHAPVEDTDEICTNPWPSSWLPVDMAQTFSREPVLPELGSREDNECLLYRAKVHWVYGTYESGKTWFCLCFVAQVLLDGGAALYVDFEDSERGVSLRLLQLGVPELVIQDVSRFVYIRPDEPLNLEAFEPTTSRRFDLAVLDGVTESMALEDLQDGSGGDVAKWQTMLPKAIAKSTEAAVLCIDHVPKATNNRVMPIGNQHKMSGLDGAAFKILREDPFGKGVVGRALVRVSKDRPAGVRAIGLDYNPTDNTHLVGEFVLDAATDSFYITAIVRAPTGNYIRRGDAKRNTWCMEQLSGYLTSELDDDQRSQNQVIKYMWGNVKNSSGKAIARDKWRVALDTLIGEGYVRVKPGPLNADLCSNIRLYSQTDDTSGEVGTNGSVPIQTIKRKASVVKQHELAKRQLEEANAELAELERRGVK